MNNKISIVTLIVVAIIAISVPFLKTTVNVSPTPVTVNVPTQTPGSNPQLGSVTGPDFYYPYFAVNGVQTFYERRKIATATTTPCSIKSPSATSTLRSFNLIITTGSSTATTWTAAKSSVDAFSTTTAFDQFSLGSGAQGTMFVGAASSTAPDEVSVIAPNSFLVWGLQGTAISDAAGTKFLGICSAEFRTL